MRGRFTVRRLMIVVGIAAILLIEGIRTFRDDRTPMLYMGVVPIGSLGRHIGSDVTIEGVRMEDGLVGTRTLLVDRVNGYPLLPPTPIWVENVELPEKTRCVLRGYETVRMIGTPPAREIIASERGTPIPIQQAAWQVQTYFVALSIQAPAGLVREELRPGG